MNKSFISLIILGRYVRYNTPMRFPRLLGGLFILLAPTSALALRVPFVGSPFAHMTPPSLSDILLGANTEGQTAAAADPGINDICYDENVVIPHGVPVKTHSQGSKFDECKKQKITKSDCSNAQKKILVGKVTYDNGFEGASVPINRCDKQPAISVQKCIAIGDSNAARLTSPEFKNACNGNGAYTSDYQCDKNTVDPTHPACGARTPNVITENTKNLPDGSLTGAKTVIASGTNDLSQLDNCNTDPKSCPIDQTIQAAKDKGADTSLMYCEGVGKDPSYNSIVQTACERNGAKFLGDLPATVPTNSHASPAGYEQMLNQIGQIEQTNAPDQAVAVNSTAGDLPTQCGVGGISGNIMYAESGCGALNSNPKSSVSGPYHFLCSTWNTYAGQCGSQYVDDSSCSSGYRNDPTISTGVMNCMNSNFAQKYADTCTQAGLTVSSCQYAIHVNGEPGFKNMLAAYQANPNATASSLCGSAISNVACTNNFTSSMRSGTISDLFAEYDKRLGGSGTVIPNIAVAGGSSGAGGNIAGTQMVPGEYYPVGSDGKLTKVSTPSYSGGNNNSFGSSNNMQRMLGMMMAQNLMSQLQQQRQAATQQQAAIQQQQQAAAPPPAPALSLTVQPQVIVRGNPIAVSWTSTGMSASVPCTITKNGTQIGQGNVGSTSMTTTATSTPGSLIFRLLCQADSNGQVFQQSTTALLQ